jgi:hypothetical protein
MAYRTIRLLGGMTVLVAVCVLHGEPLAVTDSTDSDPKKLALLVGCTRYVHLENKRWLEGPTNDDASQHRGGFRKARSASRS